MLAFFDLPLFPNELTLNLLLLAIFQSGREFNIDFDKITEEINNTLEKQENDKNKS
jgi:hypothetical protein